MYSGGDLIWKCVESSKCRITCQRYHEKTCLIFILNFEDETNSISQCKYFMVPSSIIVVSFYKLKLSRRNKWGFHTQNKAIHLLYIFTHISLCIDIYNWLQKFPQLKIQMSDYTTGYDRDRYSKIINFFTFMSTIE